jgi:hypothetical protein
VNLEHANAALFAAMALAQGEIENATKSSVNPHFKSRYADLAEVLNTIRPAFSKHGLSIFQSVSAELQIVTVMTTIAHKEGGYITSSLSCPIPTSKVQDLGSMVTYLRRYSATALVGISQEDDDGNSNAASYKSAPAQKPNTPPSREFGLIVDAIEACDSIEALRSLFDQCVNLVDHECREAQALARSRKAKLEKEQK